MPTIFPCLTRPRRTSPLLILALLLIGVTRGAEARQAGADHILWYPGEAKEWVEALPVGNGRLGAMVFGGASRERIQFNEETLWNGGPRHYHRPGAVRYLDEIRGLLFAGEQARANAMSSVYLMGAPNQQQSYQAFGDLHFIFPDIDS